VQHSTAVLLFLCLTLSSLGAQDLYKTIDKLFTEVYSKDAPGVSVLIAKGDQILYERQLGLANVENGVAIDSSSLFSVGSITKQFTVAAILQLEAQHKLQLTEQVIKYLPKIAEVIPEVTIEQLVNHTSGVPDYPRIKAIRKLIRNEPTVTTIIEMALREHLVFKPGTDYQYSNTGYLLLGKIIEAVSGQTYEAYLQQHIFLPAGMKESRVMRFTMVRPQKTTPYTNDDDLGLLKVIPNAYSYAAGGLWSNPKELLNWMQALRAGEVIPPTSLSRMFPTNETLEQPPYFGWEVNEVAGQRCYEHSGFEPGFKARSIYLPAEDIYLIAVQNTESGSPTPPLIKAAAICLGKPYPDAQKSLHNVKWMERFTGKYSFKEGKERIIKLKDGALSYQAPGGLARPVYLLDSLTLFFGDGYRQLVMTPAFENIPQTLTYRNRQYTETGQLITKEIDKDWSPIALPAETLAKFAGPYHTEHFLMNIILEDGRLFAQPEGADRLPLTPSGQKQFRIPEIGAVLDFTATKGGWTEVHILLEGELHVGKRR